MSLILAVALVQTEKAVVFAPKEMDGIDDLDAIEYGWGKNIELFANIEQEEKPPAGELQCGGRRRAATGGRIGGTHPLPGRGSWF